jgi:hypothetical protein
MLLLTGNVSDDFRHVYRPNTERPVSLLPGEFSSLFPFPMDPASGIGFDNLDQLRNRNRRLRLSQEMSMIRGTINRQRRSSRFTDNPAEVRKQAHLKFIIHRQTSLFRPEYDMREKLGKAARHGEISRERVKGENNFTAEGFQEKQFHSSCGVISFTRRGGLGLYSDPYPALAPQKNAGLQTGLKLCLPYGPLTGNRAGILKIKIWQAMGVALVATASLPVSSPVIPLSLFQP